MASKTSDSSGVKTLLYRDKLESAERSRYVQKLRVIDGRDPLDNSEIQHWTEACENILPSVSQFRPTSSWSTKFVQSSHNQRAPWRPFRCNSPEWTAAHRDELKAQIPRITFPAEQNVIKGKIVLFGQSHSGKSSFINSVIGIAKDRIVQKAPDGGREGRITLEHNQFVCGNVLVCDTMGIETHDGIGFNVGDVVYLLKGNVPKDYKFNPANPITPQTPGFNANPANADRAHCVIFCLPAVEVETVQTAYRRKVQALQDEIIRLKIPRILILTYIDVKCQDVKDDLANTFKSWRLQQVVTKASEIFNIPEMYIHPVKNFTFESFPEVKPSILLLLALKQAVEFAQDNIEELRPERMDARDVDQTSVKTVYNRSLEPDGSDETSVQTT